MEGRSPARVRNELMAGIVDVLQESATVRHPGSRDLWLTMLEQELRVPVAAIGTDALRPALLRLLDTCNGVRDGLSCLVRSLAYVEQQSTAVSALWRLVDEWEAVDFFDKADLHPLRPALRAMGASGLTVLARRASRSRTQELPAWCDNGWQVFLRLSGGNTADGELPAGMAFLVLAADLLVEQGRQDAAELVRRWNRHKAQDWGLQNELAAWERAGFTPSTPSLVPAYLLIQFEPDGIDSEHYHMSHWRQSDAEGWHPVPGETVALHRDQLPGEVERLIEQVEEQWADLRQPVIVEFILPWELLNEPVEWWTKESSSGSPTPLVMDYPVLIRSLERLRKAAWHRPWHGKWRQLREFPADSHAYWCRPSGGTAYFFHLERELKEDQQAVCVVLSQPPDDASDVGRKELLAALRAGVPAVLWYRGGSDDAEHREAFGEIVEERGLGGLMERAVKWRKDALALGPDGWDGHVGRHIALLLDDPERKPGPANSGHVPVPPRERPQPAP